MQEEKRVIYFFFIFKIPTTILFPYKLTYLNSFCNIRVHLGNEIADMYYIQKYLGHLSYKKTAFIFWRKYELAFTNQTQRSVFKSSIWEYYHSFIGAHWCLKWTSTRKQYSNYFFYNKFTFTFRDCFVNNRTMIDITSFYRIKEICDVCIT